MKAWKYIAIALGLIAVLLVTGWYLRNAIIERISESLLAEYDIKVTDVSLDALAMRDASIGYLELEHANGATIAIEELTLPISATRDGFRVFSANRATIGLPPSGGDELPDFAGLLNQFLALPEQLPNTVIAITEVDVPPYPKIRDLQWRLTEEEQIFAAIIDTIFLTANLDRTSDSEHALDLSFSEVADRSTKQSISVDIRRNDAGTALIGTGTLDLRLWSPVLFLLGIDTIEVESGTATLRFDSEIADDPNQIPFVYADLTTTDAVRLKLPQAADTISSLVVESASTTEITATISDLDWSLRQPEFTLRVSDTDGNEYSVSLADLSCGTGPQCSVAVGVSAENVASPLANIERLTIAAIQRVNIDDDGLRVLVQPNATVELTGIAGPDLELERFHMEFTSEAELSRDDDDWQFNARSADVAIENYVVTGGLTYSVPMFLDDLSMSDSDDQLTVNLRAYASSSSATWDGKIITLPGFRGGMARRGEELTVFLQTEGLYEEASVEASHNLESATGSTSIQNARFSFDISDLASRVTPWRADWNISAGTVAIDLNADWQSQDDEWQVNGEASVRVMDLAGAWNDTAFAGFSTDIVAGFDSKAGITVQPSSLEIALVEIGLPIENVTANYTLYPNEPSVAVENLRMSAFGGTVTADPFSFSTARDSNTLLIRAELIDLARVLSIEEFEAIEISGSIGAELPVTIEGQTLKITGGTMTGDAPGGVIRYLPGIAGANTDASGLGFATRALSNFEYESLTSAVDYSTNGDLILQMRLTGRNPDLEQGRTIILNLGVENNVPQMLRSLQAARAVEEVLERRLAQ